MRTVYDEVLQMKPKELSKTMEDMTFKFMNPETNQPTRVPASHYEKELSHEIERTIVQTTNRQFLTIMYSQLNALKKEDPKYFFQALICMDNNLNPKDLRMPEQIAMNHTYDYIEEKQIQERKQFRFFNQDITNEYQRAISDPSIQAEYMELSNYLENQESRELNRIKEEDLSNETVKDNNDLEEYEDEYERDY